MSHVARTLALAALGTAFIAGAAYADTSSKKKASSHKTAKKHAVKKSSKKAATPAA